MENTTTMSGQEEGPINQGKSRIFLGLAEAVLASESERAREIVKKRFGLAQKEPLTLEKIGQDYGITRERVRQIVSDVLQKISQRSTEADFKDAEEKILFTIKQNNGIVEEQKLLSELGAEDKLEANAIVFFGLASNAVEITEGEGLLKKSWIISRDAKKQAKEIAEAAKSILQKEKNLLSGEELVKKISGELGGKYSQAELWSYLNALTDIKENVFGKWGLSSWGEVNPKGTRERIYLVLKEKKKPLHFSQIAKLIDEYHLGKRRAHPQTVHNELIKDERFVLVGRGIYALREWGYEKGTIKDVLENILKKSPKPLSREEILEKVLKKRKVKKSTIMINLNNPKIFVRERNLYTIKK